MYYYGYRYYSPELGRWINRDPIGEEGSFNLYSINHNNLVDHWDYLGLDFIAVGTRDVVVNLLGLNHLSIHYFKEHPACTKKGTKFKYGKEPKDSVHSDSRELLAREWYYQEIGVTIPDPNVQGGRKENIKLDVNVSVIFVGNYNPKIKSLKVIYSDADNPGSSSRFTSAQDQWTIITKRADTYKYALNFPLPLVLDSKNWPHVKYNTHPFNPTNSNTFVREMVRSIGTGGGDGDVFWKIEIGADKPDMPSVDRLRPFPRRKASIGPNGASGP